MFFAFHDPAVLYNWIFHSVLNKADFTPGLPFSKNHRISKEANKNFMLATLKKADATGAYFMTDSSTWVAAKKELKHQSILFRGDIL